jgi:hypothetical protein
MTRTGSIIVFLNHHPLVPDEYSNITTSAAVEQIFASMRPSDGTSIGVRLNHIVCWQYLARHATDPDGVKPLSITVITDGVLSDNVESVIIPAAKKLDRADAPV